MTRKLILASAMSLLCGMAFAQNTYRVHGTQYGCEDGDTIYMCDMQGWFQMIPTDTTVVKGGQYEFRGTTDGAHMKFVVGTHAGKSCGLNSIILENADITVIGGKDGKDSKVIPGPNGRIYDAYRLQQDAYYDCEDPDAKILRDSTATEAERKAAKTRLDTMEAKRKVAMQNFMRANIPSAAVDLIFGYNLDSFTPSEIDSWLKILGEKQPQYPFYRQLMAERKADASTATGMKYTDIALPDEKGKTIRVSDYVKKNKYTLIDFWASWCGPCRGEMPNVVKAYDTFHKKGFEVIGVSLDNNKAAWLNGIKALKLPWPQMSDLKGWHSAGAAAYNIKAIPANVLVDRDGTIVAKNLRGDALHTKLSELMK